ncbi:MAG: DUF21 domain-containing protein [Planctomycetes bacterium]|nr:DUF21 domain-containing protein [Planctomycetota bacterium]
MIPSPALCALSEADGASSSWLQLLYLAAAGLLVLLNAFFVLAEFAIVKIRATQMLELAERGNARAALATSIVKRLDAYLSTCQLGITVASLGLGWIGEPAFATLLKPWLDALGIWSRTVTTSVAFAISFAFVTFIHVVIGELAPKSIAIRRTEWATLFAARPLHWFYRVTFPAMWLLNVTSNAVLRLLRIPPVTDMELAHSEEELRMILGASHEKGAVTLNRLLMMENVLDFGTLTVADVMTPAERVISLSAAAPWSETFDKIRKSLHSRYPLDFGTSKKRDRMIHLKDLLIAVAAGKPPDLTSIARPVRAVRPDLSLEDLLQHFYRNRSHLAMVEDDAGRFLGLVTIEDVIEELIGTVRDEFETVKEFNLSDLVPPGAIALGLEPMTKEQSIRTLIERLAQKHPELNVPLIVSTILRRETLASTGLGEGIAIPHSRIPALLRPMGAIGQWPQGIEFQALDAHPVYLMFLILTPVHDEGVHVHILGKISALLSSDYLRERLRHAQSVEEVREVLRISDQSLPA